MLKPVVIVPYDPRWAEDFSAIQKRVATALGTTAMDILHVGSTSIPGMAAKPIIDIDVVVASDAELPVAIEKLGSIGYLHKGEQGIVGRHAFAQPDGLPGHHLYVCELGSRELKRHLAFRDYLRANTDAARAYAALKYELAARFGTNRDGYAEAKTEFVEAALRQSPTPGGCSQR